MPINYRIKLAIILIVLGCQKLSPDVSAQFLTGNLIEPPTNGYLADSPWPMMHRNNYAQASTSFSGPVKGKTIQVASTELKGKVSPWLYFSEKYPDGNRAIWSSTTTTITKTIEKDDRLENVATFSINSRWFNFSPWGHLLLRGNELFVSDGRALYILADVDPRNSSSPIVVKRKYSLPPNVHGKAIVFNISYDGFIIFITDKGEVGAIDLLFKRLETLRLPLVNDEIAWHNQFALDEDGGIYIVTTKQMLRVNWRNAKLSLGWQAPYDFVGDGPTSKLAGGQSIEGSGTTPTLMGSGKMDKLVLVVDGHNSANMVAFWRDKIPQDWSSIKGRDQRIAAVTALPYARYLDEGNAILDYQAVENSPCAWGYDIACAQYNGFAQKCNPTPGVQKLTWHPESRTLSVAWSTNKINFNNVLTYSAPTNLVYGTGRKNCDYFFWAVNWTTGAIEIEQKLGADKRFNDQGCGNQVSDDGSLVYSGAEGIILIKSQK
jgi:hypothetical protein